MKPYASPAVSIDGERIRLYREEGGLTQLYVAKVVGVTTDTVSRWENNRYPTIRRDNAIKLAEALEVELEQILAHQGEEVEEVSEGDVGNARSSHRGWVLALVAAGALVAFYLLFFQSSASNETLLTGQRELPRFTAPGARVPIQLTITTQKKLKGLIVKEAFPPAWDLVEADPPPASLDNLKGNVRWMIRNPEKVKQIVYVLQAPKNAQIGSEVHLEGEVVANPDGQQFSSNIASQGILKVERLHWADMNGNARIDDLEILDVSDLVEETDRIHYDWDLIEEMWDAGSYTFDARTHQFKPVMPPVEEESQPH